MSRHPYHLTGPIGTNGTLGLIVLQVDETLEQDFRRLFPARGVAIYVSRIPSGAELTLDTIAQMACDLPAAVALLPPSAAFDCIGYACTSGTTLIGAQRVAGLIHGAARTRATSDPLTASIAALNALGARRIAIVSPYIETVAQPIRDAFITHGFEVQSTISFGEEVEANVARIDPTSIHNAAIAACAGHDVDAVFLSCTNLRTLDIIEPLEQQLGLPVVSSNLALAWHMAHLSGAPIASDGPGRLLAL